MLEVPHEGSGVKKADCGDAEARMRSDGHALSEYQAPGERLAALAGHRCGDLRDMSGAPIPYRGRRSDAFA